MPTTLKPRGFTLLEMLVVLVVIGLATGLVSIKAFPSADRRLQTDAERLGQLLSIAQDEAMLRTINIAWQANERGYAFFEITDQGLLPINRINQPQQDLLRDRAWDNQPMRISILVDGVARPQYEITPTPSGRAVRIQLSTTEASAVLERGFGGRFRILPSSPGAR